MSNMPNIVVESFEAFKLWKSLIDLQSSIGYFQEHFESSQW